MTGPRKIVLILLLNLLVIIVLVVCLEAYFASRQMYPVPRWGWTDRTIRPHEWNQMGYRGRPIRYTDQDFVILLVGDSQVQADLCAFEMMPEQRLEHYLAESMSRPVKVFTLGASGYGQDQQLFAMERYFRKYRADLVMLWETPINDVWNNTFVTHLPKDGWPKPTFWLDGDDALQGPSGEWGRPVFSRYRTLSLLLQFLHGSMDDAWEREHLPPMYDYLDDAQGRTPSRWLLDLRYEVLEAEKTHASTALKPVSERTRYGLRITHLLLHRMKDLADRHGAPLVAFTEWRPDFPQPDGIYAFELNGKTRYLEQSRGQYWKNVRAMNEGIDFFIVGVKAKVFKGSEDVHLTQEAVDQVIRDASEKLYRRIKMLGLGK